MASENFELGFVIDTSALSRASVEALKAADAAKKLGDAERAQAAAAETAAKAEAEKAKQTTAAEQAAGRASNKTTEFARTVENLSGTLRVSQQDLQALAAAFRGDGGVAGIAGSVEAAAGGFSRLLALLGPTGAMLAGAGVAVGALAYATKSAAESLAVYNDKLVMLQGRLTNSLGSAQLAKDAIKSLYETTQQTGLGFQSAADAFARIARNNAAIGLSQQEMLRMIETVQKLGAVSGTTGGEMAAGMVQFGQALASGRLQGDELRSIMENFPALAKAVADNFERADGKIGITIGELRKMGSEGELTGQKIAKAVLAAAEQANKEFASLPDTVERANQRTADSYDNLMKLLAQRFRASEFVIGWKTLIGDILDSANAALDNGTAAQQLASAQANLREMQRVNEALKKSNPYEYENLGAGASRGRRAEERLQSLVNSLRADIDTAAREESRQGDKSTMATASGLIARTADMTTFAEKARLAATNVKDIQANLASLAQTRLDRQKREGQDVDVSDINTSMQTLEQRLIIAQAKQADLRTELGKLQLSNSDRMRALQIGGVGGAGFVEQAINAQRGDLRQNAAGSLNDYIDAIINREMADNRTQLQGLQRQIDASARSAAAIGQGRAAAIDAEVQNEVAAERASFGSFANRRDVLRWLEEYERMLRKSKQAAEDSANANRLYQASIAAERAQMMAGITNPLDAARAGLEFDIGRDTKGMNERDANAIASARRNEFEANQSRQRNAALDEFKQREAQILRETRLVGLIGQERQVQLALLAKETDLRRQGYDEEDAHFKQVMAETERLERLSLNERRRTQSVRAIFDQLDEGVKQFESTFKSSFETVFTHGVNKASDILLQGFGGVIKKISAQMIYELAIRPFEMIAEQLASQFGRWLTGFLPGGSMGGLGSGGGSGINTSGFAAAGAYFDGPMHNFATGGVFTNKVVNKPTMFAFANGVGLMGEAGPEAIMPLRRDASGRLGVTANGGGDSGVSVVINDMRSNGNAERVQTQERRGANGKRILSVMIRDEMRRQIRSGDMDRDMAGSYGSTRVLSRK